MFALIFLRNLGPPRRYMVVLGRGVIIFGGVGAGSVFFVGVVAVGDMTVSSIAADGIFPRCVMMLSSALSV